MENDLIRKPNKGVLEVARKTLIENDLIRKPNKGERLINAPRLGEVRFA